MSVQHYMDIAIEEAIKTKDTNDVPVGAIIVKNNEIIAKAHNKIQALNNPLYHAEIIAIHTAINILKTKYLTDCEIYTTLEPCVMCAGAIALARPRRIYIGAEDGKSGACGSVINVIQDKRFNHNCEVYFGINADKCKSLLVDFFQSIRKEKHIGSI
ncbi:MAG: nucleoside deaminase [Bacteroidetes bacterium]|nr:nucleoside deaminase [Bacteroidota bacterium]